MLRPVHLKGAHFLGRGHDPELVQFLFLSAFHPRLQFLGFSFDILGGFLARCSLMNGRISELKGKLKCDLVRMPQPKDEKLNLREVTCLDLTHLVAVYFLSGYVCLVFAIYVPVNF